ncbi:MAG: peptidyl-prolyl cis-trans isomerase, partial [Bradyrhizobium sp.]|nr:peptidyl-prolyl cis-trans isomerase [Bradyrhizobium sp.]
IHGIAVRPNSEDVAVEIAPDKVILGRPGGLTLSSIGFSPERAPTAVRPMFDIDEWQRNQNQPFLARQDALIKAAADAEPERRAQARLALARFYMARAMYPEARGVTNLMISDGDPRTDETAMLMIHAVASILMGRPDQGLKDLATSSIGNNFDSQMWKGLAYARQGKFADAREKLKNVEFAIASLPLDLQRIVIADAMKSALEIKDFAGAAKRRAELDVTGVSPDMKPDVAVLRGRLAEAMAQEKDALDEYRAAINSSDRMAAAEAKLLEIKLLQKRGEIKPADALKELETLQAIWRGDVVEVQALQMMSQLYEEAGRYADSLEAARMATRLMPNSDMARQAQDNASRLFSQLFLSGKADDLPPVDALSIFYGFRELTPIGRRGDEMIRDRVAFKLQYLIFDQVRVPKPSEEQLRAWFTENHARFDEPERVSFLITPPSDEATAKRHLDDIREQRESEELRDQTRAILDRPVPSLSAAFGDQFGEGLLKLPTQQWTVLQSKDGWHVVRLDARTPGAPAKFEDLRDDAAKIWHTEETRKQAWEAVSRLKANYTIRYEP